MNAVIKDNATIAALVKIRPFLCVVAVLPSHKQRILERYRRRQMYAVADRCIGLYCDAMKRKGSGVS